VLPEAPHQSAAQQAKSFQVRLSRRARRWEKARAKRIFFMLLEHHTVQSLQEISSQTLLEGQCQDDLQQALEIQCNHSRGDRWDNVRAKRILFMLIEHHMFNNC
jgi:hypothetical protein